MRMRARPLGMVDEPRETRLLLELAKEAFRQQVAKRVRPLARSYVERWMGCELWLYPSVIQRHGNELHSYKAVVIETLRKTSLDEILSICRTTRPDLDDLWKNPPPGKKLKRKLKKATDAAGGTSEELTSTVLLWFFPLFHCFVFSFRPSSGSWL